MAFSLALVDDHVLFRDAMRAVIGAQPDLEMVVEAGSADEALASIPAANPDVIVVDLVLAKEDGVGLIRTLLAEDSKRRVVALTGYAPHARIGEAVRAGALAYVGKDQPADEWLEAIRTVARGEPYENPRLPRETLFAQELTPSSSAAFSRLTAREREVFELTVEGHGVNEIARQLFVSPRTIETHRSNILHKFGCTTAVELVRTAARLGLLKAG